jgi:hypothetical protein
MLNAGPSFAHLSDFDLLVQVKALAAKERQTTASLIATLVEIDSRRLYLGEGCSSLFTYCTQVLRLSEHAAYGRIEAARAARRFPIVVPLIANGSLTLTSVCLLSPHLTTENHEEVLEAARHKSKRDVECIVAALRPQPLVPSIVRKVPSAKASAMAVDAAGLVAPSGAAQLRDPSPLPVPKRQAVVVALAPELYKIQFTMSREMHESLRRVQDLLRHSIPNGDPAAIFDRALTLLRADLEKAKVGATSRPHAARPARPGSRHVPAAVRRAVWVRDGGRCAFMGANGRCTECGFLEYHHVVPFAAGGETTVDNVEMRCRAHNQYEADLYFGPMIVRESRASYGVSTRSGPGQT